MDTIKLHDPSETYLILSIAFYSHDKATVRSQEFEVAADNTLASLMDLFDCQATDIDLSKTLYDDAREYDTTSEETQLLEYTFVVMEGGTVYIHRPADGRCDHLDYTSIIMEWARARSHRQDVIDYLMACPELLTMQDTSFRWMPIHFARGYTLVHGIDEPCEHTFAFVDAHLCNGLDTSQEFPYPRAVFRSKIARQKCRMCQYYPAEYVTVDDINAGETPCFFCNYCFEPFHYDQQGDPLTPFRHFPYGTKKTKEK
jgi:hypothetical protein